MKKLLLIDGNAIIHRAYHAYPPVLTNTKGEVINAVYGFFSMFLMMIVDQKPDYLAVCFDRPAPNFRQTLFAGYQQHRPALADDFVPQIILIHELLQNLKATIFELDGYEADDLIGTLATRTVAENKNVEVIIVTGDRDMLQLVNEYVKVLMPIVGITKTALFDSAKVEEKYGVKPSQFIDYKALIGDASDGYPGVTGIGPKTASNLLKQYGTFENLYTHVGELPQKTGLKLATDAEQAALAKKLATIVTDAPIQFDVKKCACSDFDVAGLLEAFALQGFKTLITRAKTVLGVADKIHEPKKETNGQLGLLD